MLLPDDFAIGNAAGTARTMSDFEILLKTPVTHIRIGSIREFPEAGNKGRTYFFDPVTRESGNALGVPDALAIEGYRPLLPQMVAKAHAAGKKVVVSVHASSAEQYARIAAFAFSCGVDEVELNLSCPNERLSSGPKIIPCYDPNYTETVLDVVRQHCPGRLFEVKVSPIEDAIVPDLATVFVKSGIVRGVVGINTVPNQTFKNPDGSQGLDYIGQDGNRYHTGGRGGATVADESRRVQEAFVRILPKSIAYHAVGGIFDAADVKERVKGGARGVQTATALLETKPFGKVFHNILQAL